jgi:pimeloyl-ACP methyl ester carboxylesterase
MSTQTRLKTDLYHEVRGDGPPVVFVSGATGDAGHFTGTAQRLADEFTVVSYDRRGNSRSPAHGPFSIAAQADDAAELVGALGIAPAVVFGTSGGGNILLELLCRRPDVVRGAIAHEPALLALLPEDDPSTAEFAPIFELAATDSRAATEAFARAMTDDETFEAIDDEPRERMLANGANLFGNELDAFMSHMLDEAKLGATGVPVELLFSRGSLDLFTRNEIVDWLERCFVVQRKYVSGHHAPYLNQPEVFAEELRPLLRSLAAPR